MKYPVHVLFVLLLIFLLSACNTDSASPDDTQDSAVATTVVDATDEPTATPIPPTNTPEPTATPVPPTNTPEPSPTPEPTQIPTPTPIPATDVALQLASEHDDLPIVGAELVLYSAEYGAETTSDDDGMVLFEAVPESETSYDLTITAEGFKPYTATIDVSAEMEVITATLAHDIQLEVVVSSINARGGPGTAYDVVATVEEGDAFDIIGRNQGGSWYQIALDDEEEAWVSSSADYVSTSGNIDVLEVVEAPPAPTSTADDNPSTSAPETSPPASSGGSDEADTADEDESPDTITLFYLSNPSDVLGTFPLRPFDANTMYNQMLFNRSNLETMRSAISSIRAGDASACDSYVQAYNNILYSALFFDDVPPAWGEVAFFYEVSFIYALDRSRPAYLSCVNAGTVDEFNLNLAMASIDDAIAVLTPNIDRAAASLGG